MRLTDTGSVVQVSVALGLALVASPVVRSVTSELNGTVGQVWPFSMARCASLATPGCQDVHIRSATDQPMTHIRTGRL